jgi:hypothetical protein
MRAMHLLLPPYALLNFPPLLPWTPGLGAVLTLCVGGKGELRNDPLPHLSTPRKVRCTVCAAWLFTSWLLYSVFPIIPR